MSGGWAYNQVDPDAPNTGVMITVVGWSFTCVALIMVFLRSYVRAYLLKSYGSDDTIICLSVVSSSRHTPADYRFTD